MVALIEGPHDPVRAADAAMQIQDEALRMDTLRKVLGPWLQKDHASARQWIAASALPEDARTSLLEQADRMASASRQAVRKRSPEDTAR
jgi:hypothetical protein